MLLEGGQFVKCKCAAFPQTDQHFLNLRAAKKYGIILQVNLCFDCVNMKRKYLFTPHETVFVYLDKMTFAPKVSSLYLVNKHKLADQAYSLLV
jgi:hypothetical protein